jgi:methylenetetrahydrofolate reductase (NADPH)
MFYDNKSFFNYLELCRKEGITAPIIPGIKIITSKLQLTNIPKNFFIDIPAELAEEINSAKNEHVQEIGVSWALKQVEELLNSNVPAIHFYIMQNSKPINMLMKKLKL